MPALLAETFNGRGLPFLAIQALSAASVALPATISAIIKVIQCGAAFAVGKVNNAADTATTTIVFAKFLMIDLVLWALALFNFFSVTIIL